MLNKILLENEKVDQYRNMRTVHFGPTGVMVGVDIHFKANFGLMEIESEIVKIEAAIKSSLPVVRYVFIEVKHMESWVA
ncbi:MAG: divalent metal cation (Fe/Co/Zn/Cd) transporter [Salibacteraceae bacterium]